VQSLLTQYREKFGDKAAMPPQIGKQISDRFLWEKADPMLEAAIKANKPIADWQEFATAVYGRWDQPPKAE
jgi:uncharacterized protein HemY